MACKIPCGTKFLLEFNFVDWRFFVFCGNLFLRLKKTGFSCWELMFAISWKSRSNRNDNIFVFYLSTCKRKTGKKANVNQTNQCHSITVDRE